MHPLVHGAAGALGAAHKGEGLVHGRHPVELQRLLGQQEGCVGTGVDGAVQPKADAVVGAHLLGAGQQCRRAHVGGEVAVLRDDPVCGGVSRGEFLHGFSLLISFYALKRSSHKTLRAQYLLIIIPFARPQCKGGSPTLAQLP